MLAFSWSRCPVRSIGLFVGEGQHLGGFIVDRGQVNVGRTTAGATVPGGFLGSLDSAKITVALLALEHGSGCDFLDADLALSARLVHRGGKRAGGLVGSAVAGEFGRRLRFRLRKLHSLHSSHPVARARRPFAFSESGSRIPAFLFDK